MDSAAPPPPPCAEFLAPLYRFAFLMTGNAAGATTVFEKTLERAARRFGQFRHSQQAGAWLFAQARLECRRLLKSPSKSAAANTVAAAPAAIPSSAAGPLLRFEALAAAFASLPEPERAALALFYLSLFTGSELATLMEVPLAELARLLDCARALLRGHPALADRGEPSFSEC